MIKFECISILMKHEAYITSSTLTQQWSFLEESGHPLSETDE